MSELTVNENGIPNHWAYATVTRPDTIDKVTSVKDVWFHWALGEYLGTPPSDVTESERMFALTMVSNHYHAMTEEGVLAHAMETFPALKELPRDIMVDFVKASWLNHSLKIVRKSFDHKQKVGITDALFAKWGCDLYTGSTPEATKQEIADAKECVNQTLESHGWEKILREEVGVCPPLAKCSPSEQERLIRLKYLNLKLRIDKASLNAGPINIDLAEAAKESPRSSDALLN